MVEVTIIWMFLKYPDMKI